MHGSNPADHIPGDDKVTSSSRNELFNTLRMEWDPNFHRTLSESLEAHILSDAFAGKDRDERENDLFRLKKIQKILVMIGKEVGHV